MTRADHNRWRRSVKYSINPMITLSLVARVFTVLDVDWTAVHSVSILWINGIVGGRVMMMIIGNLATVQNNCHRGISNSDHDNENRHGDNGDY